MAATIVFADNPRLIIECRSPRTVENEGEPMDLNSFALFGKYLCVNYRCSDTVQVFDCADHFEKIKEIQIKGMRFLGNNFFVGCSVTSQLFFSDPINNKICRVDVNTGVSDVFIELGCSGLSLVENRLLVTTIDSLLMYDIRSGQIIKNIPWTEDMKKYEYGVCDAIESNRDSFFVSYRQSNGNRTVSEIDSEGRVVRVLDNKEQLDCGHLALDSVGRLLVADWKNGRVVLLNEDLQFSRILLDSEELKGAWPRRLSYNKNTNRLAVGLSNENVNVFDCLV